MGHTQPLAWQSLSEPCILVIPDLAIELKVKVLGDIYSLACYRFNRVFPAYSSCLGQGSLHDLTYTSHPVVPKLPWYLASDHGTKPFSSDFTNHTFTRILIMPIWLNHVEFDVVSADFLNELGFLTCLIFRTITG